LEIWIIRETVDKIFDTEDKNLFPRVNLYTNNTWQQQPMVLQITTETYTITQCNIKSYCLWCKMSNLCLNK